MFIKLSFKEKLKMFNQFSGALEIRLTEEPVIAQELPNDFSANTFINTKNENGMETCHYYFDCENLNVARIALQKFNDYYHGQYLAVGDPKIYPDNELIDNLKIAVKMAKEEIKAQSYSSKLINFFFQNQSANNRAKFSNKSQETKAKLLCCDEELSKKLLEFGCTGRRM